MLPFNNTQQVNKMILQLDQANMNQLITQATTLNISVKTHIKNILKTHNNNNQMIIKEIDNNDTVNRK